MKACFVNYNFTPDWIKDSGLDYVIYDRSDSKEYLKDFPQDRIIYTKNVGNADYDRLSYLVDNYHNLPEVFLWSKTNLFKYISEEEWEQVKDSKEFTPLLTKNHKTYDDQFGPVCFYDENGMFNERNDSWYTGSHYAMNIPNYHEFARVFFLPDPAYIPFAPGGNYILTREAVHKRGRDFYEEMMSVLPYCQLPGEAHMCERSYYSIWR